MQVAGIVAEYNPFHRGHAYQMEETRKLGATHVVAVMSGNLVQRGDVPIAGQWARAHAALLGGADLVLQLPAPFALASAQRFAQGAVALLQGLGCVDMLSFGSECGDIEALRSVSQALRQAPAQLEIKKRLEDGASYPSAMAAGLSSIRPDAKGLFQGANNTLGIEYLQALNALGSAIRPVTIARSGAEHDSLAGETVPSATYLRQKLLKESQLDFRLPAATARILEGEIKAGRAPLRVTALEKALLLRLRQSLPQHLLEYEDVTEGLENRILHAAQSASDFDQLCGSIKSKRYTMARIRRILLRVLFDIKLDDTPAAPPYLRVLGFSPRGVELLRRARQTATLPIIQRTADLRSCSREAQELFRLECRVSDTLGMCAPITQPCGQEMTTQTIQLREELI